MNRNSLDAHQLNIEFGAYSKMSDRILAVLTDLKEATMQEICAILDVSVHKVSGRFGTLVKSNKIELIGKKKVGNYSYGIYTIKK
ncbi:hypothetical protein UFOVP606_44 [uncultured Caudovirales phage]|uniref:Helix-turn-helix domain containing protein n=1 Tax=uncultured Caudovirales phage TaxID=2100421 RepID=A0A6J5N6W1_9CAUD|nr:hypothetical protein UFOVP606_44 [uncultured Caudovirales phage]